MMNMHRHAMARKGKKYGGNASKWQTIKKYAPIAAGSMAGSAVGGLGGSLVGGAMVGHYLGGKGGGGKKRRGGGVRKSRRRRSISMARQNVPKRRY